MGDNLQARAEERRGSNLTERAHRGHVGCVGSLDTELQAVHKGSPDGWRGGEISETVEEGGWVQPIIGRDKAMVTRDAQRILQGRVSCQ